VKVLAIIPARGGSKGVPRKNVKKLNGIPLVAYGICSSLNAETVDRVVVSKKPFAIPGWEVFLLGLTPEHP